MDDAFDDFAEVDDWDLDAFEVDDFTRILSVIRSGGRLPGGQQGLAVQRRSNLTYPAARRQLFRGTEGVFLQGATPEQALRWAQAQARLLGGAVVQHPPHGQGRPHLHIDLPDGRHSGHIFHGEAPPGRFFDYPY